MKRTRIVFFLVISSFLFSCGSKKKAADYSAREQQEHREKAVEKEHISEKDYADDMAEAKPEPARPEKTFANKTEAYIYRFAPIAKKEMELYGIPASITLAQGILESGSGSGKLTSKSNNHFGIKCNGWEGAKVYHDDDRAQECFRKYKDPKYSFRDHSLFLSERRRYAFLFTLHKDDYKAWARGLKKAGYATDPRYPHKLIDLIERYDLDRFDDEVLGNSSRKGRPERNLQIDYSAKTYTVRDGDTLWNIAKQNDLTVEQLKDLNNLRGNVIEVGQKLFVKTK
ncbi:MAG TPA: glucosaminidase domain-containing protein [Flavobacteriaceae bacterium]|nr:glucosaminidase domain-containing protein [Flavobacteriaceae bacterium]